MRKFIQIFCFLLICCSGFGQDQRSIDSLQQLLKIANEDTNKVKLKFALALEYQDNDMKTAMEYVRQSLQLSEKLHFTAGSIKANKKMTYLHATLNQQDSAIWFCNQYLKIATEASDSLNIGVAYFILGERYNFKSDYERGIEYSLKGIKIIERYDTSSTTRATLNGAMAANYLMIKDYKKAIEFGIVAEALDRKNNNAKSLSSTLINLGNAYAENGNDNKAAKAYQEALVISEENNYTSLVTMACEGMADIMDKLNNIEQVKYYAEKGLAMAIQIADSLNIMACTQGLSRYYMKTSNYVKAKTLLFEALRISHNNNYKEERVDILQSLSNVFFIENDHGQGSNYQRQANKLREEIFTESTAQKLANEEVKYETEKKESQIKLQQAQLQQKSTLNYLLIAGSVALLVISMLTYRNYRHHKKLQQAKIDELETEKKLTATEAVLKGEERERTRLAKDLHDGLGGMLSGIKHSLSSMKGNLIMTPDNAQAFERSIDMLDSSIREMRRVAHNMMPEVLVKYGLDAALKEYCNEIDRSGIVKVNYQSIGMGTVSFEQTTAVTVYRIVQELMTNSIKHGAAQNLLVQAHVTSPEKLFTLTVEDDGQGFDTNSLKQATGIGWNSIQNRIDYLKGKVDISSEKGNGTSVLVEINL